LKSHSGISFLSNLTWSALTNFIIGIANFASLIYFARHLGPSVMGFYAAIFTFLQLIFAFLSPGFDQFLIKHHSDNDIYSAVFFLTLAQAFIYILLSTVSYILYLYFFNDELNVSFLAPGIILLTTVIFTLFANFFLATLAGRLNYKKISLYRLFSNILGVIG
jgi:O-antigen/teichoic acid export membrane protein